MITFRLFSIKFDVSFILIWFLTLILFCYGEFVLFWCIFSIVFHEVCHLLFLLIFRSIPKRIVVQLCGLMLVKGKELTYWQNVIVLSSGCFGNFLLFSILMVLNFKFGSIVNLCLAIFNLLPHEKLDGGQLFELLLQKNFDYVKSLKILQITSTLVLVLLAVISLIFIFCFRNFTIMAVVLMLIFSK